MSPRVEIQRATQQAGLPADGELTAWARAALPAEQAGAELVIRLVDEAESRRLNHQYRGKNSPTNVLSFPFEAPPEVPSPLIGDLVICAPVVAREAREQGKRERAHWAHMVVHGVLHLLGYDHQTADEAARMEGRERRILQDLGLPDPYDPEEP